MCPDQSVTGSCAKGSDCKLQHKGQEGTERGVIRSIVQATRGRYFEDKRKREEAEEEERKEEGSVKRVKYGGSQGEEGEEEFIPI